jgi:hypothetical protein
MLVESFKIYDTLSTVLARITQKFSINYQGPLLVSKQTPMQ